MTRRSSPYGGQPEAQWKEITNALLAQHPLKPATILAVATAAWDNLWETTIGSGETAVALTDRQVPATVVGYFFEILFARELENRCPGEWRGNRAKEEKDLVYLPDANLSVEMKTSGQLGLKVYGNRSYGQELQSEQLAKKEKSGYYLTVNFFEKTLTLLRFGWIDADDWKPQEALSGQMAGLADAVYLHKLVVVPGAYRLRAPARLLKGIGEKTASQLSALGIATVGDLLAYAGKLPGKVARIRAKEQALYQTQQLS